MSKPKTNYECSLYGASQEIVAAISALNMEPTPIAEPKGTYSSDTDVWVNHAAQHLHAAVTLISKAEAENRRLVAALEDVMGFANTSHVAHLWSNKGEQAPYHAAINRARKALSGAAA